MNYFELFEIPVSLKVNASELQKKYYSLCRQYHPDNFTLKNQSEQSLAEVMTAQVNEAKKVLDDSNKRLEYILKENRIIIEDEKYTLSASFLGDMMDINEQLMEMEFDRNEASGSNLKKEIENTAQSLYLEVQPYFESDVLVIAENDKSILKEYYYKRKYLNRIANRL